MKTEFQLSFGSGEKHKSGEINIIGQSPDNLPYVAIYINDPSQPQTTTCCWIEDKDLERFAVNILKALKSKRVVKITKKKWKPKPFLQVND